ncbi:MAG: Cys-tRNA(Pro) deacylase [Treponema sp.]|jgi:Cys-tRNA(Pro)/Cys-tRNA(Cys) deacylase|nr:Cys-tRNA(Pro) deacylase [Treponema sp.]
MQKTNAMRLLDAAGIQYSTAEYEVDERDLSGVHAARMLNMPVERVFKTLVLRGASGAYIVCCIPVVDELDLRKVARVSGEKNVELIPMKELPIVSGYVRGGCSPIGMKKLFPTYIDETAELFDDISISAGARGVQIIMKVEDLNRHIGTVNADLVVVV